MFLRYIRETSNILQLISEYFINVQVARTNLFKYLKQMFIFVNLKTLMVNNKHFVNFLSPNLLRY